MKFRPVSDIHLEFYQEDEFILPMIEDEANTTLILAGDVGLLRKQGMILSFLEDVCNRYKYVFYIGGNHEWYHGNITEQTIEHVISQAGHDNLFTNRFIIENENIAIVGDTLWTDFRKDDPMVMELCRMGMNDYRLIRLGESYTRLTPGYTYAMHKAQKNNILKLADRYKKQDHKVVVVTHHHPSYRSMDEEFRGSDLNYAYMSDLDQEILEHKPDWWVCGHQHRFKRYAIGETQLVCNPIGYPGEVTDWNKDFIFEL